MERAYLDNNATTQPLPSVREAVMQAMGDSFGNPSSPTLRGARARERVEACRDSLAALLGGQPEQLVFTSGCTEGNNTVLRLALEPPRRIITSATEHASVAEVVRWLETQGVEVCVLNGPAGRIEPDDLRAALRRPASLVSIQWANSETGVLQPIKAIADLCRTAGVPLHVDAAQAVGRVPIDLARTKPDFLTFSGHKLHAPQGIGVTFARQPADLPRLLLGGGQQDGRRAGTENLPGIEGLRAACDERRAHFEEAVDHMRRLRDDFERRVLAGVPGARINAGGTPRVCNTSNIRFPVDGQALMAQLAGAGIVCSQTSACAGNSPEPSGVLTAIGLSRDAAFASVRFSFSVTNDEQDVDTAAAAVLRACERLGRLETL